jgi:hypothetical protein
VSPSAPLPYEAARKLGAAEFHVPYSEVRLPHELRKRLPWLFRYSEHLFCTPAAIRAIALLVNQKILIASVIFFGGLWAKVGFDWARARWLMRHGLWQPGTHYSTMLPALYRLYALAPPSVMILWMSVGVLPG